MRGKLVCKRKHDKSGNITRYKVCYVAKGYAQIYSLDYDKTTAPTAHLKSFCILLHIGASLDWDIHQFDIKTAFLNEVLPLDEIAYMEQPAKAWVPFPGAHRSKNMLQTPLSMLNTSHYITLARKQSSSVNSLAALASLPPAALLFIVTMMLPVS